MASNTVIYHTVTLTMRTIVKCKTWYNTFSTYHQKKVSILIKCYRGRFWVSVKQRGKN